ncbi:MAG: hypothetical protein ABFC80_00155 [Coriobacteriales bacterium]
MLSRGKGRPRAALTAVVTLVATALVLVPGCSVAPEPKSTVGEGEAAGAAFEPSSLAWAPSALEAHLPGIVGWRQVSEAAPGQVVVLSEESSPAVVWEGPSDVVSSLVSVDAKLGMLAVTVRPADGRAFEETTYLCHPSGTVVAIKAPEGYEPPGSLVFLGNGSALALATRFGAEAIESTIGVVSIDGSWSQVALTGELPEFQYVERLFPVPGTDAFAVVLKTAGTPANRDDEALVLARYENGALRSFTPPFRDDCLPNAVPLWNTTGVVFVRSWRTDAQGQAIADLVEAVFSNGQWAERVLASGGGMTLGIESGTVAVPLPDGKVLVRTAGSFEEGEPTSLVAVESKGALAKTGLDVTGTTCLLWMEK